MVWATELRFDSFGHSFGLDKQIHLGIFSYPITVMGVIFVTNAFNLMDGADGVAGSLVLLSIVGINIVEIFSGHYNFNILSIAILGSLIPYLYFNIIKSKEKKVFLGDSGSLFLGYSVACLLLYESQIQNSFSPPFALWVIAIPIFDVISVMVYRLKNSQPLFVPDRSHLHYVFQRLGLSNSLVLISIIGSGVFCLMLGFAIEHISRPLSFPIFLILLIFYVWLRSFSKFSKYNL
jgi:UDP-GlcNAc:undecaprenyl-phosphate GlcNAc-1-phosphate transferase